MAKPTIILSAIALASAPSLGFMTHTIGGLALGIACVGAAFVIGLDSGGDRFAPRRVPGVWSHGRDGEARQSAAVRAGRERRRA